MEHDFDHFIEGLKEIQAKVHPEATIHGISWWNGCWEIKVLNRVELGGILQNRLETWSLRTRERV